MKLAEILRISVAVEPPVGTGRIPAGESRVIAFADGSFEGDGMSGRLLPGGSDWQRVREDGVLEIRAHYMLQTLEGENIEVISEGLRAAPPDVLARLAAGEDVPPDAYYFRTFVRLQTAAERFAWMNDRLFVGVGVRQARGVRITVYEVP